MILYYGSLNKKYKIKKLNNLKLKHLALQGAFCYILEKKKDYFLLEIEGRGRVAIEESLVMAIEVESV